MVSIDIDEKRYDKLKMCIELFDLGCSVDEVVGFMIDGAIDAAFDDFKKFH